MYNNEEVSFEKIYFYYLTLLVLSFFLKCGYTSVSNGLAFWNRDLTSKILRFATWITCDKKNKQTNKKKLIKLVILLLKCIIAIPIFICLRADGVRFSRQDHEYLDISALYIILHTTQITYVSGIIIVSIY